MMYLFMISVYTQLLSLYITHLLISLKKTESPKQEFLRTTPFSPLAFKTKYQVIIGNVT